MYGVIRNDSSVNRWENGHAIPNRLAQKMIRDIWKEYGFEEHSANNAEKLTKILIVDDEIHVVKFIKTFDLNCSKLSENREKPALQNADIE